MLDGKEAYNVYKVPRGTKDILPDEQRYWRLVEKEASDLARLYGFRRIDTPEVRNPFRRYLDGI